MTESHLSRPRRPPECALPGAWLFAQRLSRAGIGPDVCRFVPAFATTAGSIEHILALIKKAIEKGALMPHDDQGTTMTLQPEATAIHAVPAQWLERGFRLLILRELYTEKEPPAFAWIEQHLLRTPQRLSRHGLSFASTFLPEIMAWLSDHLGRPSLRERSGQPYRNSLWPSLTWHSEDRLWPGGIHTIEWFVDVIFQDEASWTAFQQRWHPRLMGKSEASGV